MCLGCTLIFGVCFGSTNPRRNRSPRRREGSYRGRGSHDLESPPYGSPPYHVESPAGETSTPPTDRSSFDVNALSPEEFAAVQRALAATRARVDPGRHSFAYAAEYEGERGEPRRRSVDDERPHSRSHSRQNKVPRLSSSASAREASGPPPRHHFLYE